MSEAGGVPHRIDAGCTNCEACMAICPTRSIYFGQKHFVIDRDTCEGCAICVRVCPVNVIHPIIESAAPAAPSQKQPV